MRTKRWKYGVTAPDKNGNRDSGSDEYVEQYLYDLEYDPYELTNLVGWESHRQASDVLKERLIRRMVQVGEAAPVIHNAPSIPKSQRKVSEAEANS